MNNSNIWTEFMRNYMIENDLLDFYNAFLEKFEIKWNELISTYSFTNLCQLNNGNRLRPMLVVGGYLLNKNDTDSINISDINDSDFDKYDKELNRIIDFCVMVEAIHKMSLLIDDWIDNDIARHGVPTFHSIYGADTTVLLAINILLKGYLDLGIKLCEIDDEMYKRTMSLALQIAYDMTNGALGEVSSKDTIIDISQVKQIVDLETSSIIRNGIVLGYIVGGGMDTDVISLLNDVGYCCGYIFQALNDMEPFGNADELVKHKGTLTTDILHNRKNIVVAYIYTWASENEIEGLIDQNGAINIFNRIVNLIKKYNIDTYILQEIANLQLRIEDRLAKIEKKTGHLKWCNHFKNIINITISASKKRALGQ